MRFKAYSLIRRAVEDGVQRGHTRAHKHTDKPGADAVVDTIVEAVMGEVCEVLVFDVEETL